MQVEAIEKLLTKPSQNVSVYLEQEFVLRVEKGTTFAEVELKDPTDIHGTIDRLVVYRGVDGLPTRAEVIDWKTDSKERKPLEELIDMYAPQLATYRLAAAKLLGIDVSTVSATIALLSFGKVVDITQKATIHTH